MAKLHLRFVALLMGVAGCGGTTSDGLGGSGGSGYTGPPPIQSVGDSRMLSTLTPQEVQSVCQDLVTYVQKTVASPDFSKSIRCAASAYIAGTASGSFNSVACHQSYDQCVQQPTTGDAGVIPIMLNSMSCTNTSLSGFMSCQATVGQLNTCLEDSFAIFNDIGTYLCDHPDGGAAAFSTTRPASCQALEPICPALSTSSSGGDGG
jgi:hypothetical protein